jgi:spore germination protein YaaH
MNWRKHTLLGLVCAVTFFSVLFFPTTSEAGADRTSKFRVYQKNSLVMEFSNRDQAISNAKKLKYAYVEQIGSRTWIWNNFPQYKVYQYDYSKPDWEFHTMEAAVTEAKKWANASVRKLSTGGWVWNNYRQHAGYTLFQGERTLPQWQFQTFDQAKFEGKKWANAFIIDNATHQWMWDNIPDEIEQTYRTGEAIYQIIQNGKTLETWKYAFLKDAFNESIKWANSIIVKISTPDEVIFENKHIYVVFQDQTQQGSFVGLQAAIKHASNFKRTKIIWNGRTLWTNEPYYHVFQTDKRLQSFATPEEAVSYGIKYANAQIYTLDGSLVWDNLRKLIYLGWSGSSKHDTIVTQMNNTQGLDIHSPTWFSLLDASGTLKDESDPITVTWLKSQGVKIHPLVHNQFDAKLTSAFLANSKAQQRFIQGLIKKLVELKLDGVNLDFESIAGADRDRYTAFVKLLSESTKANNLTLSIDLPRGSAKWNHLTAYDHTQLAQFVDYIAIMAYDQFYRESTSPGPVSGLQWAEIGVQEFLAYGIPRSKLLLGVPFYVRVWELDTKGAIVSNRAVFMKEIDNLLQGTEAVSQIDEKYGLEKVEFIKDGKRYVFWKESVETMKLRVQIAKKYNLAGIAAWRLGYEPLELWLSLLRLK